MSSVIDRLAGPENAARRTLAALVACALAVLPLHEIFSDWAWLPDVWLAMLLTIGPAVVLRMRWAASGIHLVPGLIITVFYLTARFVPDHAWGGFIPVGQAWSDVGALNRDFHDLVQDSAAPLHSTPAARMVLCALLVLLAVSVDLVAVVARRPALAGVPFLLLFTLAGAMPRHAVGWLWFVLAAFGYLLLLSSDARDEVSRWGRLMPHTSGTTSASSAAVKALTGRRIAVIAIVVALAIPLLLPIRKSNLLADAIHGGTGTGGSSGSLDPFARLKGQLNRHDHQVLFDVTTEGLGGHRPLYLVERILDTYSDDGWRASSTGVGEPLDGTAFQSEPDETGSTVPTFTYTATITSKAYDGNAAPLFQSPVRVEGLRDAGDWTWSRQSSALVGGRVRTGDAYSEGVAEPQPSAAELRQSAEVAGPSVQRWLRHPAHMPPAVLTQVQDLIKGKSRPYDRALAILDFFSPANGFVYSLTTKAGDSGNDLVDFLTNRTGFCQQYAAAMGIMLRLAGIPARVVLGYTHQPPNEKGQFSVTSDDAHAWVEGYFDGIGWLPFDPTPLVGTDAARGASIPWAPKPTATGPTDAPGGSNVGPEPAVSDKRTAPSTSGDSAVEPTSSKGVAMWTVWLIVGIALLVILIGLVPAGVRAWRRRRRLRAAARDPDPLWQELADTAVDLGYVWSPVRTPRQVVTWLRREGVRGSADGSLQTLAGAVERSRYAAPQSGVATQELVDDLRRVEVSLRSTRSGWERARARLLPPSLGWGRRSSRRH